MTRRHVVCRRMEACMVMVMRLSEAQAPKQLQLTEECRSQAMAESWEFTGTDLTSQFWDHALADRKWSDMGWWDTHQTPDTYSLHHHSTQQPTVIPPRSGRQFCCWMSVRSCLAWWHGPCLSLCLKTWTLTAAWDAPCTVYCAVLWSQWSHPAQYSPGCLCLSPHYTRARDWFLHRAWAPHTLTYGTREGKEEDAAIIIQMRIPGGLRSDINMYIHLMQNSHIGAKFWPSVYVYNTLSHSIS